MYGTALSLELAAADSFGDPFVRPCLPPWLRFAPSIDFFCTACQSTQASATEAKYMALLVRVVREWQVHTHVGW